ncbi:insulin-like binding protein [Penaeus vannamei]|uniref:Insulin-like binding protein n=1 Tax=Penaeus vannamei TaxID=6689 RepID=A0A423TIM6_PENVA|nr:insulin-like binding protein [Penaeus vannamei]
MATPGQCLLSAHQQKKFNSRPHTPTRLTPPTLSTPPTAPVIVSAPEDAERPEGSILVLDCEVKGYPVPDVTWELNLEDGSSFKLPGDMSSLAVQVRGGPEKFMATGWVQIMRIKKDTVGTYSCVATNSEGEARAAAKVQIRRAANEKEESLNMV